MDEEFNAVFEEYLPELLETLGGFEPSVFCVFFLMIRRPPRSTPYPHSFPTRRSSDLGGGSSSISSVGQHFYVSPDRMQHPVVGITWFGRSEEHTSELQSHSEISYA